MNKNEYKPRLVDKKVEVYLNIAKALLITGPKWCGKTWTSMYHASTSVSLMDKNTLEIANTNPNYILGNTYPQLIDEWQVVPEIWDAVRNKCDEDSINGKYILTGSTTVSDEKKDVIKHSGVGRIIPINMYPMTIFEQGLSEDKLSLLDLKNNEVKEGIINGLTIKDYANIIIRGGFPGNINTPIEYASNLPKTYLDSICNEDIFERKSYKKSQRKMEILLASLARNEATLANNAKIIKDMSDTYINDDYIKNTKTLDSYIEHLENLYVLWYQNSFSCNYRSSKRLTVKAKRHFIDVSLAAASLKLTPEKLLSDLNTFGFLFESLVERDLKVFMDYYNGELFHFRDNISGDEVDAICEFSDGEYGAIEIKLTEFRIEEAKASLMKFYKNVEKKPKFMCVIVGESRLIKRDLETGIYIIPFSALGTNLNK